MTPNDTQSNLRVFKGIYHYEIAGPILCFHWAILAYSPLVWAASEVPLGVIMFGLFSFKNKVLNSSCVLEFAFGSNPLFPIFWSQLSLFCLSGKSLILMGEKKHGASTIIMSFFNVLKIHTYSLLSFFPHISMSHSVCSSFIFSIYSNFHSTYSHLHYMYLYSDIINGNTHANRFKMWLYMNYENNRHEPLHLDSFLPFDQQRFQWHKKLSYVGGKYVKYGICKEELCSFMTGWYYKAQPNSVVIYYSLVQCENKTHIWANVN